MCRERGFESAAARHGALTDRPILDVVPKLPVSLGTLESRLSAIASGQWVTRPRGGQARLTRAWPLRLERRQDDVEAMGELAIETEGSSHRMG